ncbi:RecB family exonuclease [Actinoalloteichus caeruleus]
MQGQLGLEGMPKELVRVTPARLQRWEDCPRRYRATYLDRPAPARGGAWAHSTLGAVVHNVLRAYFESPPDQRDPEDLPVLLRRYWKGDGFRDREQAAEYRSRAAKWLDEYARRPEAAGEPVALERWVSAPTGALIVEGRVDRIDDRDGQLVVVDYKTGRHVLTTEDARDSRALALYLMAARRTLRRPGSRVELHHLPTGRVVAWDHDAETLAEHRRHAERIAEELSAAASALDRGADPDEHFPPRPGRGCSVCEFRRSCPEGRAAAPDLEPWDLLAP